jgi:hypothetical protein
MFQCGKSGFEHSKPFSNWSRKRRKISEFVVVDETVILLILKNSYGYGIQQNSLGTMEFLFILFKPKESNMFVVSWKDYLCYR